MRLDTRFDMKPEECAVGSPRRGREEANVGQVPRMFEWSDQRGSIASQPNHAQGGAFEMQLREISRVRKRPRYSLNDDRSGRRCLFFVPRPFVRIEQRNRLR